jgi:hypothetical protein
LYWGRFYIFSSFFFILKQKLFQYCLAHLQKQVDNAKEALQMAEEASKDDTKSSAGDKYETGREMAQQDINRNGQLLLDAQQKLSFLQSLANSQTAVSIKNGSLIYTNKGNFYLSVSVGQIILDKHTFYAISSASPIGKLFLGKKVGEEFTFNGQTYQITDID